MSNLRARLSPRLIALRLAALLTLVLPVAVSAQGPAPTAPQEKLAVTPLSIGIHAIQAEVADTEEERRIGLMFRETLPGNEGMLFVFNAPDVQCFWMRNTRVPLSTAFISDDGTIVNIEDMAPQTDTPHCSRKPVRYVLEMAQGWFAERGLKANVKVDGLP
ncbi:exported protein [Bordetella ansorpii]|uniref:Exported protein n=1 Tax=Bordetella ansorpii TaxID=288768 RepID=A0A157RCV2_9BORD|nr:DUF192 domain-containing protein [Bordetella ansorpii]SAI55684.1 exported protein [Bordetella ansorpii]